MGTSKTIATLLVGMAVGAAAGILLAPYKGSKTRRKILKAAESFFYELKDQVIGLKDRVTDESDILKNETEPQ